ncbi:hypothetical protein OBBRIDRAFT_794275 [Obba rivulosa]|uniref:Uncharacterized protein n=1 Tax=Obba rivulosa TaxID=1052685 RepID=A0A8E2DNB5_9APHY|nr:hypothetical protein OBBRIDRAFT_794275 [Obba rivulosa]
MPREEFIKEYLAFRAQRVAKLPENLKPSAPQTRENARQTSALKKLERILYEPFSFEPLPPIFHYGYPIKYVKLQEIAADLGYTPDAEGYNSLMVTVMATNYITGNVLDHPAILTNVFCEGQTILIVSLCTNWEPRGSAKEAALKLKEFLGEVEGPKWYIDREQWFWRE